MDVLSYFALIPALGGLAQWLAWRTRLPAILLLLGFGIALGQFISPDEVLARELGGDESAGPNILFPLVSLAVAVVLFEGGLTLRFRELRESGTATLRLVTMAALLTMGLTTIAACLILKFDWQIALLLGAILTVTGPTVIGPMLQQIRPSRRVASTLKWEGIVIDPIGAVLAVLVFEEVAALHGAFSPMEGLWLLFKIAILGSAIGVVGGIFLVQAIRRYWIPDNLQGIASLAMTLGLFALSNWLAEESGLIAVTVFGVWLANRAEAEVEHVIEFKEHLRTLLIGCLFILLGSRLDVMNVVKLGWPGVWFLVTVIVIVRPVSVFVSMWGTPLNYSERTFVALMAPRGIVAAAVSSLFALKLVREQSGVALEGVDQLVDATFLVIIGTVAFYGLFSGWVARRLGLAQANPQGLLIAGADSWIREFAKLIYDEKIEVLLVDINYNKIAAAKMDGVQAECSNILSDHVQEELELGGIGRLLALTSNDEVNSIALREFRHRFDSAELYQLAHTRSEGRRALSESLQGRILFNEETTFSALQAVHDAGGVWKKTKLTETYDWDNFTQENRGEIHLLALIDGSGYLRFNTVDIPLEPSAGQTVIALVAIPTQELEVETQAG